MNDQLFELVEEKKSIESIKNRIKRNKKNIYEACISENFFDYLAKHYDCFKWIELNGSMIGFMLFSAQHGLFFNDLIMETYYVLPEFRNEFDLSDELE